MPCGDMCFSLYHWCVTDLQRQQCEIFLSDTVYYYALMVYVNIVVQSIKNEFEVLFGVID